MADQGEQVLEALNALANRFCAIESEKEKARKISLFREKIPLDNYREFPNVEKLLRHFYIRHDGRIESSLHVSNYKEKRGYNKKTLDK